MSSTKALRKEKKGPHLQLINSKSALHFYLQSLITFILIVIHSKTYCIFYTFKIANNILSRLNFYQLKISSWINIDEDKRSACKHSRLIMIFNSKLLKYILIFRLYNHSSFLQSLTAFFLFWNISGIHWNKTFSTRLFLFFYSILHVRLS